MAMVTIIINRMKRVISPIIRFLFSILPSFLPRKCRGVPSGAPGKEGAGRIITFRCHTCYGNLVLYM
jgi:hypothetical protein